MSVFDRVPLAPPDPIFGIAEAFKGDTRKEKVNLTVGAFKNDELKTPIMQCIKEAEKVLIEGEKDKDYLPISGSPEFCEAIGELVFGKNQWGEIRHRTAVAQITGGTGALFVGGKLLFDELEMKQLALPNPTWANHKQLFSKLGFELTFLPYYDHESRTFHKEHFYAVLQHLPPHTPVLLHASCHNPSGCDLTDEEWEELSDSFLKHKQLPFFDIAYQGLGQGVEEDVFAPRHFAKEGHEMLVTYTCAKNFSIYAERTAALFFVCESAKAREHVLSKMKSIIRVVYSNPPLHGAAIVAKVLKTPQFHKLWQDELKSMRQRLRDVRTMLATALSKADGDSSFIMRGNGLFALTGLNTAQVERLKKEYAIYMPSDGRINISGITKGNLDHIVSSIVHVKRT